MATFIFDLDMTLVNSSALDEWRESKMWSHVRKNLGYVKPFSVEPHAPHKLPARIKSQGHKVAIVTSSPRWYAEALIKLFKIETDVLVAWGDTEQPKPDREPIVKALEKLGVDPNDTNNVYHVGDAKIDVEASYHAGVVSIGAGWGVSDLGALSDAAPDVLLLDPGLLLRSNELEQRGYFAEMLCCGISPKAHRGAVLPCGKSPLRLYALGRYFKTKDPRHEGNMLSESILAMKDSDGPAEVFAQALAEFVRKLKSTPDYIVPVPPKPSQSRSRFEAVLKATNLFLPSAIKVSLDRLKCVREVEGYKTIEGPDRAEAIHEAFESPHDWNGAKILLLDDVLTTGATVVECARVLLMSNASEVRTVTFGKSQRSFVRKECPDCTRLMRVLTNSRTGEKFWGCSGYHSHGCRHTENV